MFFFFATCVYLRLLAGPFGQGFIPKAQKLNTIPHLHDVSIVINFHVLLKDPLASLDVVDLDGIPNPVGENSGYYLPLVHFWFNLIT